jgi:hypothetical protein
MSSRSVVGMPIPIAISSIACGLQHPGDEARPVGGVTSSGDNKSGLEFGTARQHRQRPRVIDVGADVGVENDWDRHSRRLIPRREAKC